MIGKASMMSTDDERWMREALSLSHSSVGLSGPNPRVGCVIVSADGHVLGTGYTQRVGGAHAEVRALQDAYSRGVDVRGATAYVTLEPCSHHGRTPPCCDAIISAGLSRVVVAVEDPNPVVRGTGNALLRVAGIRVDCGLLEEDAREINIGFFCRMLRGRPWVRLKSAVSLDGRTALFDGTSRWITGEAARADGHKWRRRADAIVTGIGTVLGDNPRLDVRFVPVAIQPSRIVLDSTLRSPLDARVFEDAASAAIYTACGNEARIAAFIKQGVEVKSLPGANGKVALPAVLDDLARRGVNEIHVEAGEALSGAFISQDLVDEYLIYLAPKLIGEGRSIAALGRLEQINQAKGLYVKCIDRIGQDIRLLARPSTVPNGYLK